jgi:hypothetical protein
LRHRRRTRFTIDRDRFQASHRPTDDRYPHQLLLQYPRLRRKDARLSNRFPRRRMFPHRYVRTDWNVLKAFDSIAQPTRAGQNPHLYFRPAACHTVQTMPWKPTQQHHRNRVEEGADEQERSENDGTQQLHAINPADEKGRLFGGIDCEAATAAPDDWFATVHRLSSPSLCRKTRPHPCAVRRARLERPNTRGE